MPAFIRPSDYRYLFKPTSPIFAYIIPWLCVLIGQQLALCTIIKPIYSSFYLIILGNMLSSLLIAFCIQTFFPQSLAKSSIDLQKLTLSSGFKRITYVLIIGYLSLQLFQFIYFKGFPLLWLLTGVEKTYFDFGVGSLNGLLNAIYLLSITLLYLIFVQERKTFQRIFLYFLMLVPILIINRQLFMSAFLQITCCMLLYKPKVIKKMALVLMGLLLLFIVIGNMRTGSARLAKILGPKEFVPESLHSLLWVYAYMVTPFNNINAAMDSITPLGSPYQEISTLVPSVFRGDMAVEDIEKTGFTLVHQEMNVSSFYLAPLLDFGAWYAFFFMLCFQIMLFLSYRRALLARSWIDVVEYSVLYMVMALSIFTNLFLYLPVITQVIIIKLTKWQIYRSRGIIVLANDRYLA